MFQEEPFPPEPRSFSQEKQATAMKSRVNREVQARFCEGLGVKFPGATRPDIPARNFQIASFTLKWLAKKL